MASRRTWLIAPALLFLGVFLLYPTLVAIRLAFTDDLHGTFPSLSSFRVLADDPLFARALLGNLILPVAAVGLELAAGLGLALLLSARLPARRLLRTAVILPFAIPEIVFLTILRRVLEPHGYANGALALAGLPGVDFLAPGSVQAFASVVVVDAWRMTPVVFLILLGALAAIPAEVQEAARLDGARGWQRLRRITIPLLRPALLAALLLRGLDELRIFAAPLVLGGVEGVPVLSTYAFHQWADYDATGAASAASLVLALLACLASIPLLRRRVAA